MAGSKRGKRYEEARKKVDRDSLYGAAEALNLVVDTAGARFDETVELAARLGVDPRHAEQQVRGTVVLPHGTGKSVRVLVFAKGDGAREAEEAGAEHVGAEELAEKIQGGWLDFDVAIAAPDMMSTVGKLGKILGPKGLMPNPKAGTVTQDVGQAVRETKAGKVEYRVDRTGIVHVPLGKVSFGVESLRDNYNAVVDAIIKARPAAAKGQYVRSLVISSTMGPGIKVNPLRPLAAEEAS